MALDNLAVRIGNDPALDRLTFDHSPARDPGPNEIRVRIEATSLNYADYCAVTGKIPIGGPNLVPMTDGAGTVEAIGSAVQDFAAGDRVVGCFYPRWQAGAPDPYKLGETPGVTTDGFAARFVTRAASWFTRAPATLTTIEAGTLGCAGLTAWRALFVEGRLKPGDWVLIQGSGGVSLFALQFAKACGARVVATSSSDEKLKRLKELGADALVNYRSEPNWGKRVFELADDRGVDLAVEIGGGPGVKQTIDAVAYSGSIMLIGVLAGFSGDIPTGHLMFKNACLKGITVGGRDHQMEMIRCIDGNGIKPVIDSVFPLEALPDAFRAMEAQKHFGKITVQVD